MKQPTAHSPQPILLQINTVVNSGSTGRLAEELGQYVIENGWKSFIAFARNENESSSVKIKIGNIFDIYWHGLLSRLFDKHGLGSKIATRKFIKQIEKIKPTIIHLHNIHGYYINYKILFSYLANNNIPVIWTMHDCWSFTGHCTYFTCVECDKWKKLCFKCPQKKKYPASIIFDRSEKNYKEKKYYFLLIKNKLTLISVSDWLCNVCSQSFFKSIAIYRIYNAVDTRVFKPIGEEERNRIIEKYKIAGSFLIIGVANVWDERKGMDDFIKLRSLLPDKYSILLVGLSENQINNLPYGITGITRTENISELAGLYSSANVFFNPSVEETFGLTSIEAVSTGTPVIVYNSSASPEIITQEIGFVVNIRNFSEIIETIYKIEEKGKNFYTEKCHNYIVEKYDKITRNSEYLKMYNEIIQKWDTALLPVINA